MYGPLCLYIGLLSRLLGLPVVQEMCEWFPIESGDTSLKPPSSFTRWLYRKPIFRQPTGVLVISKLIESRVRQRAAQVNPSLLVHRLTSIVDSRRFVIASPLPGHDGTDIPHFLWCGVGYVRDVHFLVRLLALINAEGYPCRLRIVSANYLGWSPETIRAYANEHGLPGESIEFMGRVDDRTLEGCYKSANGLLLPLWDDDRSKTRIPNKLAEYLAAGRPVVTCKVGDLSDFLMDGVNAYVAEPGAEREFADRMIAILRDPDRADQIGAAGQRCCLEHLDYRVHSNSLAKFFMECIERSPRAAEDRLLKHTKSDAAA
jgi:glycosyltransferase involved in cell wall biosynthesis